MKQKKTIILLLISLALLNSNIVYAEFDNEGLEDIEIVDSKQTPAKKNNADSFLEKDLAVSIGGSSLLGNSKNGRDYAFIGARYEKKWGIFKLNYDGLFEHIKISASQTNQDTQEEFTIVDKRNQYRTNELYLNIDLLDNLLLSAGKQKIIWGQLEPYSPNNFVFPLNLSTTSIKFSKATSALPQNAAKLSFYPTERLLLETTYFVGPTYDYILDQQFKNKEIFEQPTTYNPNQSSFNTINKNVAVDLPKGSDKSMYGFRMISYQDWGTIGMSYFDGYATGSVFEKFTLKKIEDSGKTTYYADQVITLSRQQMIGMELSVPLNSWTIKFEYARFSSHVAINAPNYLDNLTPEQQTYAEYVVNENKGKLYIPKVINVFGLGLSSEFKRWDLNFILFNILPSFDSKAKIIYELQQNAYPEDDRGAKSQVFPGMLISYYFNEDKISSVNLAAGNVGNGAGFIVSYSTEFIDSLDFSIGYQSITYFSDIEEDENGKSKRTETAVNGVIVGIEYGF